MGVRDSTYFAVFAVVFVFVPCFLLVHSFMKQVSMSVSEKPFLFLRQSFASAYED